LPRPHPPAHRTGPYPAALGEWLRREGRRFEARTQLRAAYEEFTSIGMEAFAERARRELIATGETVRKRTAETWDDFTAQEAVIARLARLRPPGAVSGPVPREPPGPDQRVHWRDGQARTGTVEGAQRPVKELAMNLAYDVFVNDPPPPDGFLPNGEPKRFSPMASTLIYGAEDAVLTDPGLTEAQARALGDWVAAKDRNVTDIFITHGHGDHWFAAGLLAERFGARVVASAGTITQMKGSVAARPLLWDKLYQGIPPAPVTAVTVPGNRLTLEGHDLAIVEVGHTDSDDTSVLHVPNLGLVVAGDAIYNGVHMYLAQSAVGGFGPWRDAIARIEDLVPRHIVAGHQNQQLDDNAARTIAETRRYLDDAEELLYSADSATGFFNAKIQRYPDHLGRMILWVSAQALYGVRQHPDGNAGQIILSSWF
jgi:glyoxylase-like metal-dependent hydrolase (beta-lactamase superfamily II)